MKAWLRGGRSAALVIGIWAAWWAFAYGGFMEVVVDPNGVIEDIWPAVLGIGGIFGGVLFALLLWIAERQRGLEQVPWDRLVLWGGIAGWAVVWLAAATHAPKPRELSPLMGMGVLAIWGVVAAIATGIVARFIAKDREDAVPHRTA